MTLFIVNQIETHGHSPLLRWDFLFTNNLFSGFRSNLIRQMFPFISSFFSDQTAAREQACAHCDTTLLLSVSHRHVTSHQRAALTYTNTFLYSSSIHLNCNSLKPGGRGWRFYLACFHFKTQRDSPGKQKNSTSCVDSWRFLARYSPQCVRAEHAENKTLVGIQTSELVLCFVYCWLAKRKSYPSSSRHAAPQLAISATIVSL